MQQEMSVLGIDIAKRVLHAVGMDDTGKVVYRKRLSRHDLKPLIAKLPPVRIGREACGGAHYWARRFRAYGHEVKLMAPQFVRLLLDSRVVDIRTTREHKTPESNKSVTGKYTQGTPQVHRQAGHRGAARWQRCKVGNWIHVTRRATEELKPVPASPP